MGGRPSRQTSADMRLKSNQPAKSTSKPLTTKARNALPKTSFAIPATKSYPIEDKAHARNALARVAQNGTTAQKAQVRKAVASKYPTIKVTGAKKSK